MERRKRLLIVEDDPSLRASLRLNFEHEGYDVTVADRGSEALDRVRGARFDGVVMDVMLPDVDGFTICETMRVEGNSTPVLFLTARTAPNERVRGLRTGDDHLAKPFDLEELLLRVSKMVGRGATDATLPSNDVLEFGGNRADLAGFTATGQGGVERKLSEKEVKLLRLLFDKANQVVSREEILEKVWGYDVFPTTRTIDNFIVAFRKLFEPDPRVPRHFHSVRGVGYRFTP